MSIRGIFAGLGQSAISWRWWEVWTGNCPYWEKEVRKLREWSSVYSLWEFFLINCFLHIQHTLALHCFHSQKKNSFKMRLSSKLAVAFSFPIALATDCSENNCLRAIQSKKNQFPNILSIADNLLADTSTRPALADCNSFLQKTVTPSAVWVPEVQTAAYQWTLVN